MKVLLLEDNPENIKALQEALKGHEVALVTEVTDFFYEKGTRGYGGDKETDLSVYDAVITDVNMPAVTDEGITMGPIGLLIGYKALQHGVRRIWVITDSNHHEPNVISKGFDLFNGGAGAAKECVLYGERKMLLSNHSKKDPAYLKETFDWLFSNTPDSFQDWYQKNN